MSLKQRLKGIRAYVDLKEEFNTQETQILCHRTHEFKPTNHVCLQADWHTMPDLLHVCLCSWCVCTVCFYNVHCKYILTRKHPQNIFLRYHVPVVCPRKRYTWQIWQAFFWEPLNEMPVACCPTFTRKWKSLVQTDTEIKAKSIGVFLIETILF